MTAEIFLKRPHPGTPWGFRLIGGSDSHLPIIVSKVIEGSVAEQSGLEEDVLLERIYNVPTSGLTHAEVNQIILAAEDELLLTIRRVDLENLILASLNEEENNSEITNILREAVNRTTILQEETGTELEELGLKKEFGVTMIIENNNRNISENQTRKEDHVYKNRLPQGEVSGKKWSTFLQKPKNPKPKPKNQDPPIPKSEQYRVIITKQPKREKPEIKFQGEPQQEEKIEESEDLSIQEEQEIPMELEISVKTHVTEETEITVEDAEEENIGQSEIVEGTFENAGEKKEDYIQYDLTENEEFKTDVTIENPLPEETLSLEEQLAAVQKQLQELAQLPSSIQETLAVVTKQLAHIVGDKKPNTEDTDDQTQNTEDTDDQTQNEEDNEGNADANTTEADEVAEKEEGNPDIQVEEASDRAEMEDLQSDILSDICEEQEISETTEQVNYEELLAAQLEEQRIEEERQAKHQLYVQEMQEEEKKRRRSLIRPIILPGGRKWIDEDDVAVKVKNPKMTDEKICDTLESFSEVIIGNTKGINFLKYTPPAKNLEYLQRSEVYRLVHGMEPPVRGISLRSEKVLAAQDYYTAGSN